jgi:RHS repeat-associated protein
MRSIAVKTFSSFIAIIGVMGASQSVADMGRTAGQWGVSPSGAATYSVPIWVQPGPKGVQPSLSFNYSSQAGNGTMGVGWSLSGFGSIDRCPKTAAEDSIEQAVLVTNQDRFCLNGNKLRITSAPEASYGATGAVYQTQIANFSRVTSVGTVAAPGTGPEHFIVEGKDGLIYEYGNTADSRIILSGTTVYRWLLNKVRDRDGNSYAVTYTVDNTEGRVPLTASWGPISAGASNYQYQAAFNYTLKSNDKDVVSARQGPDSIVTRQILNSVTIGYSASGSGPYSPRRQYVLTYLQSPTTTLSRLSEIKECATTTSICLKSTTISYQNGVAGVSASATTGLSTPGGPALSGKFDFNGDGRNDIAYFNGSTWRVAFSIGSGLSSGVDTGITGSTPPRAGRFAASYQDSFLINTSGTWTHVGFNGVSFTTTSTGTPVVLDTIVTDFNGDGLHDLVWATEVQEPWGWMGYVFARRNTTSGTAAVPTFDSSIATAYQDSLGGMGGNVEIVPQTQCPSQRHCDINGDGAADLTAVIVKTTGCSPGPGCVPTSRGYDMVTGPSGYFLANESPGPQPYLGMNFNDDRCTDTVVLGSLSMKVSGCGLGVGTVVALPGQPRLVMDWDGDGRGDLLVNAGGVFGVYRTRGSIASPFEGGVSTTIPYESNCNYFAADIEGDSLEEIVCASTTAPYAVKYYTHNGGGSAGIEGTGVYASQIPDLAIAISDGYGNSVSPAYVSTSQRNYTTGSGTALPLIDMNNAMTVVGRLTVSDAIGTSYDLDYSYKGGRRHLRFDEMIFPGTAAPGQDIRVYLPSVKPGITPVGKWVGFEEITVVDSRNGLKQKTTYEQMFPRVGMQKAAESRQSNDTLIGSSTITNLVETLNPDANNQRYFPYQQQISSDEYEVGGSMNGQLITTSVRTLTWNYAFGNVLTDTTVVTDKDSVSQPNQLNNSWTTAITNTYESALTAAGTWCVGFVSQVQSVQTTTPATNTVTRTTSFQPDASFPDKCRVKVKTVEPSNTKYEIVETYGFDAFGNVSSTSVVGRQPVPLPGSTFEGMGSRDTSINWGTTGQFPTSVTDASGAVVTFGYNYDVGTLQSVKDPNHVQNVNHVETTYLYDPFNRKTRETRPDGTYTSWTYNDCVTGGCVYPIHRLTVGQSEHDDLGGIITDQFHYFDALDRPLVSRTRLLNGTTWDGSYQWAEMQYDALGRIHRQYMPCSTTAVATSCRSNSVTNSYDLLNRLTQESRPRTQTDGTPQTTVYGYAGRTFTTTDAYGKVSTRVSSADSTVRQVKDANNYAINFVYDAAGTLAGITDSESAVRLSGVQIEYGFRPFVVASTDSALGASTQTFNSLGDLVRWTDASSQQFEATYDNVSRMRTRTEPGASSTFDFGTLAGSFNIGKLTNVSTTVGGQTYSEAYTYDNRTRLQGRQISIPGDSTYTYNYAYEPDKGWLDTLTYPVSTSGYRLALRYGYQNGIVRTVSDANVPSTVFWKADNSNAWGQLTKETLGNGMVTNRVYDSVTAWLSSIQSGSVSVPTSVQSQSYLYDLVGNVTQRQNNKLSLTETFYYGSPTDNLYRLEHSTLSNGSTNDNFSATYNLSGSILSKNEVGMPDRLVAESICWTSYNYPSRIVAGNESTSFAYGPFRQRWRMSYADNLDPNTVDCTTALNATQTTLYIGGLLEKITTGASIGYRHSIAGGDGRVVALYTRSGSAETLQYVFDDHARSTETFVENGTGTTVNASFTAFGLRRDASTWSGVPTNRGTLDDITRQGFTYQTVLGAMGMNHMNGRVQDAINGKFISADPFITNPENTQNYNRYSYVLNNPLSLVDPSGFGDEELEVVVVTATPKEARQDGGNVVFRSGEIIFTAGANSRRARNGCPAPASGAASNDGTNSASSPGAQQAISTIGDTAAAAAAGTSSALAHSRSITGTISYKGFDGITRSFSADIGAQARYLEGSAGGSFANFRTAGRMLGVAGAAFAVSDIQSGLQSGNRDQVFSGSYSLTALGVGIAFPPVGLGMGIAKVVDDVTKPPPRDLLEEAAKLAARCP